MLNIFSAAENSTFNTDIILLVVLTILTLGISLGAIWLISYSMHREEKGNSAITLFAVSLAIGIVVRIVFAVLVRGHRESYTGLIGYGSDINHFVNYGTKELWANGVKTYPISLYVLYVFYKLGTALGFGFNSVGMQFVIKLPMIICDVISAFILFKLLSKFSSKYLSAIISGLFMLIPVTFFSSVIWTSDVVFVLPLLLLSFYFIAVKNYAGMFISFSAAMLTCKDAIFLFPLFAVFEILAFVRACKFLRRGFTGGFKGLWTDENVCAVIKIPVYFVCSLILSYLVCLPLTLGAFQGNFAKWFSEIYWKPLTNITLYGTNSLSIYNIFGRNEIGFDTKFAVWFVIACALIVAALTCSLYLGKKNRANLSVIGAFTAATVFIYFIGFNAIDTLILFPILLLAFGLIKDKRLLTVFAVFAFAFILNGTGVMAYYGEFNNVLSPVLFGSRAFLNTMNIISSIIAVLAHLYMIVVTLDISSGQRKLFAPVKNAGFIENMKNWLGK